MVKEIRERQVKREIEAKKEAQKVEKKKQKKRNEQLLKNREKRLRSASSSSSASCSSKPAFTFRTSSQPSSHSIRDSSETKSALSKTSKSENQNNEKILWSKFEKEWTASLQ